MNTEQKLREALSRITRVGTVHGEQAAFLLCGEIARAALRDESPAKDERAEFPWRKEPPNEQCLWWWWDGDEDSAPCPVSIMYSGTNNNYFAAMDQHGWNESQDLEDMGGLWCKVREPEVPTREQQEAARKALATKGWETV